MLKILLIGNEGSFSKALLIELSKNCTCHFFTSNEILKNLDIISGYQKVIYIGGETRDAKLMHEHNFIIPRAIFDVVQISDIKFVYLSSLSVFGNIYSDVITTNSVRNPIDLYGKSKNEFDEYVISSGYRNFLAFMPASIHSGKGRSSVEKYEALQSKYSVFKYFGLKGSLSFVYISEVIEGILKSDQLSGFKILSNSYLLAKNQVILFPKLPLRFFKLMNLILGNDKTLKLRMLIRGIEYK